jgi:hypothetical protein
VFVLGAMMPEIAEILPPAVAGVVAALEPWSTGGALVNFVGDVTPEEMMRAYTPETQERLRIIKQGWDPANVFRFGYAIR